MSKTLPDINDKRDERIKPPEAQNNDIPANAPQRSAGKSMIVFDVKPFGPELDLDLVAQQIINEMLIDGVKWEKNYKKIEIAFGIQKLRMACAIEDDLVSVDYIIDRILVMRADYTNQDELKDTEIIQSVDILSFNAI